VWAAEADERGEHGEEGKAVQEECSLLWLREGK
jgi:hypothetical protein